MCIPIPPLVVRVFVYDSALSHSEIYSFSSSTKYFFIVLPCLSDINVLSVFFVHEVFFHSFALSDDINVLYVG